MEYNSTRNHLVMREYGRHIQKMVEYLLSIEDVEERQRNAYAVIELMGFLNPHLKNVEDFRHKLWDHLFKISDFKLEVESPYPIPTRETLQAGPMELKYPKRHPRFSHMGKNLELLIKKGMDEQDPEKRNGFANTIAYYMKLAYANWHKETVHDDAIQRELAVLTDGQLEFTNTPFVKSVRPGEIRERERGGFDYRKKHGQKYQNRNGNTGNRGNDQRGNMADRNDTRNGNGNGNRNKFKKRFK